MPVIPHAFHFFASVGLLLRADALAPEQTDVRWEMDVEEALQYVNAIGRAVVAECGGPRPLPRPCPLSLLGGEPLAQPSVLERLLDRARHFEMAGEVWTTPAWVGSYEQAFDILRGLHSKVHGLYVHTNAKLIDHVGLDRMESLLRAARAAGVPVQVRCGVGPGRRLPRELLALEAINSDSSFVHVAHIHSDAAPDEANGDDSDFYLPEPSRLRCAEKFGFFVIPGGDVFPCLAGVRLEPLRIGNLAVETVEEIVERAIARSDLCQLRAGGTRHLFDRLVASPAAKSMRSGYLDPCDFHRHALMTPELAHVLKEVKT